ncbi:MAG: hypothetical protein KU29_13180 [Sulfurovum sp. FS06-10]|jgi:thiol-disulfide isomerase/thioredoxin|nr:MAG: hypothetical protein KU29_13180 [Sulfurovum sp. FS06-10]
MQKKRLLSSLCLSPLLLFTACIPKNFNINGNYPSIYNDDTSYSASQSNQHQLRTIQGETITIIENGNGFIFPQYRDKIVLLQIFGKTCEYCFEEIPIINQIENHYAGKVKVIAIQGQDRMNPSEISTLTNQYQMNYPIIEGDDATNLLAFISRTYNWTGVLPYMLLIKDGVTEFSFSAGTQYQEFQESIDSL